MQVVDADRLAVMAITLTAAEAAHLAPRLQPRVACGPLWVPINPTPRQQALLLLDDREVLFGGGGGGGKSWGLLSGALQYVCVPGYNALLIRRTLPELDGPGGLISLARSWLAPHEPGGHVVWSAQKRRFTFRSGATLGFGYLMRPDDRYQYQGLTLAFAGFDELTQQGSPAGYTYVGFSRLRRPSKVEKLDACPACGLTLADVPLRTWATSNPGGHGHMWVRQRFMVERSPRRGFLRAQLGDNPYLDATEYRESLAELPTVERERLLNGDWDISDGGRLFQRHWITGSGLTLRAG